VLPGQTRHRRIEGVGDGIIPRTALSTSGATSSLQ
jgi:hypothetical protein